MTTMISLVWLDIVGDEAGYYRVYNKLIRIIPIVTQASNMKTSVVT